MRSFFLAFQSFSDLNPEVGGCRGSKVLIKFALSPGQIKLTNPFRRARQGLKNYSVNQRSILL